MRVSSNELFSTLKKAAKSFRMVIEAGTLRTQRQVSGISTLAFERFAAKLTGNAVSGVFSIGSRDTCQDPKGVILNIVCIAIVWVQL